MSIEDIANEFYEEKEVRVEEQDLRLLKALVSDDQAARELINSYDSRLFVGDAKPFAEKAVNYFKNYSQLPTRRVMIDSAREDNCFFEECEQIWDRLDNIDFNKSEFSYDLDKIKGRFTKIEISKLRDNIPDDVDLSQEQIDDIIGKTRYKLDSIEKVRKGKGKAYVQKTLKEYMPEFRENFIQKSKNPELGRGILTGYSYIDYITNGLNPSDMLIVGGETGGGKAQPLDTPIPTPDGFKLLKDIHPGDVVLGRNGKVCNVVAESDIIVAPGWKFIFNDNSEAISHENHEWLTFDRGDQQALYKRTDKFRYKIRERRSSVHKEYLQGKNIKPPTGRVKESKEIAATIKKNGRNNHAIPLTKPLELEYKDLLIDPYVFGLWLGDGHKHAGKITTADQECFGSFINAEYKQGYYKPNNKANTYQFLDLITQLRKLGVYKNKHIPHDYLWSSKEQRLSLLQGLMDSDSFVGKRGQIEFTNTNKKLAEGVVHLVISLGEKCTITEGKLDGRVIGPKWDVRFCPSFPIGRLNRKLERQNKKPYLNKFRYIKDAVRVDAVPMKCIQVDSEDHMYLTGENLVPTHNSMLLANMAKQMWMQTNTIDRRDNFDKGHNVLYFSLEMPYDQCVRRHMASMSDIPTYTLRDCQITDPEQLARLADCANFIRKYPYEFDLVDIPRGVSVDQIEDRYLESVSKGYNPKVVVVDYLGLMESDDEGDDWLRLGNIAGRLHEFARVYNIVVLTAVQLNRAKAKDPREAIGLHRIGRSSNIMHHATIGIQILTRENEDACADLEYHVIKNRNGERGSHNIKKRFQTATLVDFVDEDGNRYVPKNDDSSIFTQVSAIEDISDRLEKLGW